MNASKVPNIVSIVALVVSATMASVAHSQVVDTSEWACNFCPFESGQRSDFSVGVSTVSDSSAYFGDATGYSEEGAYANVDGSGSYTNDGHRLNWQIEDLGLDSRYAELSGALQGTFGYNVAFRQIPQHRFFTTESIFRQSVANSLSLPAGWVRAPDTSGFTELNTSLARTNIESDRTMLEVGGKYMPSSRFRFSVNYRRHERDGLDIYGGSYFTQSSLLPGTFDYVTDVVDFGIRYSGDNGSVSLRYYMSDFDNSDARLEWENPFTSSPGAETAALARPPDNSFQQLSLSGRYRFTQYHAVAAFSAALGRMEQDEAFLPYTTNANLTVSQLPRSSLDAQIDTINLATTLTAKLFDGARIKLAYRYNERDNRTAQDIWTRVIADSFVSGESETNIPYSFERSTLNLSGHYDLFDTVRVSGGYDRKTIDRDFQEVAEQTEDSGWGSLRWRPYKALQVNFKAGASERDIDRYNEAFAATLGQNPLMRKYNLAYRYRRFGELTIAAALGEAPISLTINALYADDDYTQSQLGITAADDLRVTADMSWALSDNSSVYVSGGYENMESEQFGSELFAFPDWRASNNDRFYTAGTGFNVRQIGGKFDLRMDYTRSDGTSEIDVASAAGGLSRFPNLESTLDYLRVRLSYHRSNRLEFLINLRYQRFKATDWALAGVEAGTIPVVLTLGADPYDDEILIFGLGVRYRMGVPATAQSE